MMMRASICLLAMLLLDSAAPALANADSAPAGECAPPANFSKRFPALTEKKALRKVSRFITHESPNVIKPNNPVTGADVTSNDLYAQTMLGVARYGRDHTFAAIRQPLSGARTYSIRISDTEYVKGTRPFFVNEVAEIYVPVAGKVVTVPRSASWEEGFCGPIKPNEPSSCFNTAIGSFDVSREIFEALAASDPSKPISIKARMRDGTMKACPYYFAPLSFKATLLTIDEAFAKAVEKHERRAGQSRAE